MLINELLIDKGISKYRLSKESGVPQATINDICSGKADIEKCSAGTLYKIARILGTTVENIIEDNKREYRIPFERFKSNACHILKDLGDVDYMLGILNSNKIRILYENRWYPEAFYLLGMLDYLSRINDVPLCENYNDIRANRLSEPVYPSGVLVTCEILKSDEPKKDAEREAIPEFLRFNIIENEVRNIV